MADLNGSTSIHEHHVVVYGRKWRAGWEATAVLAAGAVAFDARSVFPWPRVRTPAVLVLTACAYAACFRRDTQ
jgi:hypothetical protein